MVIEKYLSKLLEITETWFRDTSVTNLDGYCMYRNERSDGRRGGAVCFFDIEKY